MQFGPLTSSRPSRSNERPVAGLGIHDLRDDARAADGRPMPALMPDLVLAVARSTSGALTATTGDISVQP